MVIGLIGKAGCGKSTAANALCREYGFIRIGFADAIKQTLFTLGLFSHNELWNKKTEKSRQAMQEFGEWVRRYDYMFWTDKCYQKILELRQAQYHDIVIDDVRRIDEAEMIQRIGGKLVRIFRDSLDTITDYSHISETEMDEISTNYIIRNNDTILQLQSEIIDIARREEEGRC